MQLTDQEWAALRADVVAMQRQHAALEMRCARAEKRIAELEMLNRYLGDIIRPSMLREVERKLEDRERRCGLWRLPKEYHTKRGLAPVLVRNLRDYLDLRPRELVLPT